MSKHTPGPWRFSHTNCDELRIATDDGKRILDGCGCCGSPRVSCEADARLIAAAPELLEALERVKSTGVFLGAIPQEMVDAAIAKAKGE